MTSSTVVNGLRKNVFGNTGVLLFAVFIFIAIFSDVLVPYSPERLVGIPDSPPSAQFLMGTDNLGRDVLSRVMDGTRYTLVLAIGATLVSLIIGVFVGGIAGYSGGWIDTVLSRLIEIFVTIPRLFLVILLSAFLGAHTWILMLVIGGTMWPINARLMRAQALTLRKRAFVNAAEVAGVGKPAILMRHILPNSAGPIIANAGLQIAYAILLEAGLSFLGLSDPTQISWGRMIQDGRAGFPYAWWQQLFPGLAIVFLLLAVHLLSETITRMHSVHDTQSE